ncbi:MAG: helix-turn-helix transcriptional regulator [Thermococcus sp.]|uniref:ArsR/SmtB family transcription factor n=1 Tax=Thermococcus sp. TaxID=35749 RepID=UPI001D91BBFA|nr:helix-turn-helix domain-containing protein [Thermococcus sp.]MBO8174472.1 helix-turn-helix transcriptional regulator [Thermococcus sp.]
MEFETISVDDERAKELAQILMNEKSLAILRLLQEKTLSLSEIARELDLPLSTVSYHIDKMVKVGLVEVVGKKYGKRLQEVKLYRASPKPILLLPRRISVKDRILRTFEKIQVISLSIAGLIAYGVYNLSKVVLTPAGQAPKVMKEELVRNLTQTAVENATQVMTIERVPEATTTTTTVTSTTVPTLQKAVTPQLAYLPYIIGIITFVILFLAFTHWFARRNL